MSIDDFVYMTIFLCLICIFGHPGVKYFIKIDLSCAISDMNAVLQFNIAATNGVKRA